MIGFINRADIPRLVTSFIIGIILLLVVGSVLEHFHAHGNAAAVLFLVAFVGIFKLSGWAGEAIWDRISHWF